MRKKNMFQASQYIEFDFKISDGDINPSYITYAGYIRLDTANLRIENMKIEATTYDENSNLDEDWSGRVWSMVLEDLPFSFPEPHLAEFEAEDSDVSNKVVNLTEIIRYDGYLDFETGGFEKCSQTLKSYSFESNGLLNVLVVIRSD